MQIISRKEAKIAGLGKYFTGEPCKYHHLDERYTQSGTCVRCVANAAALSRTGQPRTEITQRRSELKAEQIAALLAARDAANAARAELVEIKVRAYPSDLGVLRETVVAMGRARYPVLTDEDFAVRGRPTDVAGGTGLYRLPVSGADIDAIREVASVLLNSHAVNVQAARERIQQQAEQMADEEAAPLPEWKP